MGFTHEHQTKFKKFALTCEEALSHKDALGPFVPTFFLGIAAFGAGFVQDIKANVHDLSQLACLALASPPAGFSHVPELF